MPKTDFLCEELTDQAAEEGVSHRLRNIDGDEEIKAAKLAADSFRENPEFNTAEMISNMETGKALVSTLDAKGAPSIVEVTKILPPKSSMKIANFDAVEYTFSSDSIYGKYEKTFDPMSAYEEIDEILNYTIKSLIDHLQELYDELPEEARDLTIGEMIDKIMEEEPEETDSETEDPAE